LAPLLRSNVTPATFLSDANNEAMVRQLHGYALCHDFLGALCVRMHSSFFDWIQALCIIFPVPTTWSKPVPKISQKISTPLQKAR
jgi:hypothetical protein